MKIKSFIKNNILGIIIGGVIFGSITGVVAATISSSNITYTNNGQSTVEGAIDDLYAKANRKITGDGVTNVGFKTNITKTIFANSNGLCFVRKGKFSCIKANNWDVEKDHVQQVFSDISCDVGTDNVYCSDADFFCFVYESGKVSCYEVSNNSRCVVNSDGTVNC